jgi:hypothetical protein
MKSLPSAEARALIRDIVTRLTTADPHMGSLVMMTLYLADESLDDNLTIKEAKAQAEILTRERDSIRQWMDTWEH